MLENKKPRTAAQLIAKFKTKKAHNIPQHVIDLWVEAMTREGKTLQTRSSNWKRPKSKRLK